MLGRFKAQVVSAGMTSYTDKRDGKTKPRFVVKVKCFPGPDDKDSKGNPVQSFIREWSGTYNEGDNQMYTDEALMRMGYMWSEENFVDFDDLANGWNPDAAFEAVIFEEQGKDKDGNIQLNTDGSPKMFEKVKSIWEVANTEVKNALAKEDVVNVMAGLQLPPGKSAAMRERIMAKNGGKMPEKKAATTEKTHQPLQNDASFAADDIPF